MKLDNLNNTLSVLARVTGVRMEDATVQIGKFNFTIGQLTDGVPAAANLATKTGASKHKSKPAKVAKAAKAAKRTKSKGTSAAGDSGGKRGVGKPVSPEGLHRRDLITSALQGAAGPMALSACVQAVLPEMEKFILGNGGKWDDTVSNTQNQLIRYDLKKMVERGDIVQKGSGRETTFRIKAD